jgi:hypothetical protein
MIATVAWPDWWCAFMWARAGLSCLLVAFAFLKGDWEERSFAALAVADMLARRAAGVGYYGANLPYEAATDGVALVLLLLIALRSDKFWPLVAGSVALASLMTEAAQALLPTVQRAYGFAQGTWELATYVVLGVGTWRAWRARRRGAEVDLSETADTRLR